LISPSGFFLCPIQLEKFLQLEAQRDISLEPSSQTGRAEVIPAQKSGLKLKKDLTPSGKPYNIKEIKLLKEIQ